jgi:hypothetical protein
VAGLAPDLARQCPVSGRSRLSRRAVAAFTIAAAALTGCTSSPAPARPRAAAPCRVTPANVTLPRQASPPAVPAAGAYFGGFALSGDPVQENYVRAFNTFADQACRRLTLSHVYLRWQHPFPTESARALARQGTAQLVSWTGTDTRLMASGTVDRSIAATAHQIAALRAPVFLELRWEMDRPNLAAVVHGSADYIAAWDRARKVFAAAGVRNVAWVWCPTAAGFANGRAQPYYPGDSEVDWVCSDVYPDPYHPPAYQPLSHLARPFLNWTKQHDKPVMIGEYGDPRSYPPAQRAAWFDDARATFTQGQRIKAVAYFDLDAPGSEPRTQFGIGTDPQVLAAFQALANDPYFRLTGSS